MTKFINDVEGDLINIDHIVRVVAINQCAGSSDLYEIVAILTNTHRVTVALNFEDAQEGMDFFNKLIG